MPYAISKPGPAAGPCHNPSDNVPRSRIVVAVLFASLSSVADAGSTRTAGVNLNSVTDYASEAPFIDVLKRSRPWVQNFRGQPWGQGEKVSVDDRGWPTQLLTGQRATTLLTPSGGVYPGGDYACTWSGSGRISVSSGARLKKSRAKC